VSRAGAALSTEADPRRAAVEAAAGALRAAGASRADAALVLACRVPPEACGALLSAAADTLGTEVLAGASAAGVLAGPLDAEEETAVAVLALVGVEAEAFLLDDLAGAEEGAGLEVEARIGGSARERDLVMILADAASLDARRLVAGLGETLAPALVVGAGTSCGRGGSGVQWRGLQVASGAASGLVLRGEVPPRVVVSQGCRPVTDAMTVTRSEGHWVLEIDGRPALEVYREVARGPLAEDLRRASGRLLVALPGSAGCAALARGDFAVRNVSGFAEPRGAFAVAEALRPGARIALALRDGDLARDDLKRALEGVDGEGEAACALYLSCTGRGRALFGHPGLEVAYVDQAVGVPLAGLFGSFQIAPVAGRTELLTYAGVLALAG
jgi:small ligand-binding sensory domain FIST